MMSKIFSMKIKRFRFFPLVRTPVFPVYYITINFFLSPRDGRKQRHRVAAAEGSGKLLGIEMPALSVQKRHDVFILQRDSVAVLQVICQVCECGIGIEGYGLCLFARNLGDPGKVFDGDFHWFHGISLLKKALVR